MRYEHALRSAHKAVRPKRPGLGLLILLVSAVFLLTLMACAERAGDAGSKDTAAAAAQTGTPVANPGAGDPTAPAKPLPPPPADLATDTIPLRTPDNGPARYGIPSGRIYQVYKGARSGFRMTIFDQYGMRERRVDSSAPYPSGTPGPFQNTLFITTRDFFGTLDKSIDKAWRRPNDIDDLYMKSDSGKRFSLGDLSFIQATQMGERLPDTVIDGYHCRVVKVTRPGFTDTRWVWRGIMIRQHFAPVEGGDFYIETVELTPNVPTNDSLFTFPQGTKLQELPAEGGPRGPGQGIPSRMPPGMPSGAPNTPPMAPNGPMQGMPKMP
jgi:hypothetical protein